MTATAKTVPDVRGTDQPDDSTWQLLRRALAEQAVSAAPWNTVEDALRALNQATPPPTSPDYDRTAWEQGLAETLGLVQGSRGRTLSPAGHFLLFQARPRRGKPYRWFVVHAATGTHLTGPGHMWPEDSASPRHGGLDLSKATAVEYLDALERLVGRNGMPIDWGVPAADLPSESGRWRDPHTDDDSVDATILDPGIAPGMLHQYQRTGLRHLHRAAVLHVLAADPTRDLTTATVQDVVVEEYRSVVLCPFTHDLDGRTGHLHQLLLHLNGGRRRNRHDQRTPAAREDDARIAEVATLAALAVAAGKPRQAVRTLRTHAETLQRDDNWHSIRDRAPRLMRAALLIAEQYSPAVTERQRLRQTTPGDVIVFLHPELDGGVDPIDRVLLVLGPAQYVEAGTTPRAERFGIPVNDITDDTTSVLLMVDTARFRLTTLDHAVPVHVHSEPRAAADSWAVLPPDAASMGRDALAVRARDASRRAANAFDATAPDLPHPN